MIVLVFRVRDTESACAPLVHGFSMNNIVTNRDGGPSGFTPKLRKAISDYADEGLLKKRYCRSIATAKKGILGQLRDRVNCNVSR